MVILIVVLIFYLPHAAAYGIMITNAKFSKNSSLFFGGKETV